jgi:protoporphyrinogen oxidase
MHMDAIIVGGGTAGLAAAHELRKKGLDYLVLEADELAGGRLVSAYKDGYIMDLGVQFFFKFYDTLFGVCRDLGIGDDLVSFPFKAALWRNKKLYPMAASIDPKVLWGLRKDLMKFHGLSPMAMAQAGIIMPKVLLRRKDLHFVDYERSLDMDDESLAAMANRIGCKDALEEFLQPVASCLTLGEPEEIGVGYGLALLWYCLNGLYTLKHGIGQLATALYEENKDRIRLSTPVDRIVLENGKVKGVEAKGEFIAADKVICAVTATKARELMPDLPETLSESLKKAIYSECCHVMFGLNQRVLPEGWFAVATSRKYGLSMAGCTDNSCKSEYYAPSKAGIMHCFTYGKYAKELNKMSDEDVKKQMIREIQVTNPNMPDDPRFTEIYRWKEAVCVAPPGLLKDMADLRNNRYRTVEGLFLAGEYFYMPSSDGAIYSGQYAARELTR